MLLVLLNLNCRLSLWYPITFLIYAAKVLQQAFKNTSSAVE